MRRRLGSPDVLKPWPSYVDALSSALVVLVFLVILLSIRSGKVLESISSKEATRQAQQAVNDTLAKTVEAEGVTVIPEEGKLRILLPDALLFESGHAEIRWEGQVVLRSLAVRLNKMPGEIEIQGHTDDRPITGSLTQRYPTNWELSTARATSVVRLLIDQAQVPATRLSGVGYGEHRPIAPNDTPEGRARNRRIEMVVETRVAETASADGGFAKTAEAAPAGAP